MNKAGLVDSIAREAKLSKVDALHALDAFINAATRSLKRGERVVIVGFGTFVTHQRAARTGRNPKTGKTFPIKAKRVAKFRVGLELAKAVDK